MEHPRIRSLVERVVETTKESEAPYASRCGTVPVGVYTDQARLEREQIGLFRRLFIPLACSAELSRPGALVVRELANVSLLITRDKSGAIHAFKNACRHRGTRLVREDSRALAVVCPYHGWTYALDGALTHVPHPKAFPQLETEQHGLSCVRVEERHGLVWASLDPNAPCVADQLGEIDEELGALGLATHSVGGRVASEQRGNWKMLMEAFLEGYHIKKLHRTTIHPFFLDARSLAENIGDHVRHASARKTALDEPTGSSRPLREIATYAYVIFPCTVLIAHPDWTSLVVVQPLGTDRFSWSHTQLIEHAPENEAAEAHYARSFKLIEEGVFQAEDLFAIAEMQAGLATGANDVLTFGRLESPALWLHDAINRRLGALP